MATRRAEGKRSFKYKAVEEEEEEEEDVGNLRFGEDEKKKQREMMSSSSTRAYGSGGSTPVVVCQVENCDADFADAKPYHRRHKVCELHAKAPAVHLHGLQKRFCQQCSRLETLVFQLLPFSFVSLCSYAGPQICMFSSLKLHMGRKEYVLGFLKFHLTYCREIRGKKEMIIV